jgi:hypothetical protein
VSGAPLGLDTETSPTRPTLFLPEQLLEILQPYDIPGGIKMTNLNRPSIPNETEAFGVKVKADWDKIYRYYRTPNRPSDLVNPQYQLAPEYFQFYRDRRPSELATRALKQALLMWGNLSGVSERKEELEEAVSSLIET